MIGVRGLRVRLGSSVIVDGVDLDVAAGEWVTVIGPNGAGKSTVLRAVGGMLPFSGAVSLSGTPLERLTRRERARTVATVVQSPVVPPGMLVLDYVLLGRTPYIPALGRESAADLAAVQEVLELVDRLRAERGLTVLATMHDLTIAGEYADRMVLLAGGRVVAAGTAWEVLTEDLLARHYRVRVKVIDGGQGPLVVPVRG